MDMVRYNPGQISSYSGYGPVTSYSGYGTVGPYSGSSSYGAVTPYVGTPLTKSSNTIYNVLNGLYEGYKWAKGVWNDRPSDPRPSRKAKNMGVAVNPVSMNGVYTQSMMYPQPSIYPKVNWEYTTEWGPGLYDTFGGGGLADPYLL